MNTSETGRRAAIKLRTIGAALLALAAFLDPTPQLAVELKHQVEAGLCRIVPGAGICMCSLSSIETQLTFGEAAGVVELFYRSFPDESYVELLGSLLKQCSGWEARRSVRPRPGQNVTISESPDRTCLGERNGCSFGLEEK